MSTISASTTTTTAYQVSADTTGTLVIQTGATPTTAVTVNGSGAIGVGSSPSYGTSGQALTSAGSGASPTWTTIGASAATPTALGTVYGLNSTASPYNSFYGYQAGNGATLANNVYIGYQAGYTGGNNENVAVGYQALYTEGNTGNGQNTAVGTRASYASLSAAYNNTSVGWHAGYAMTSCNGNTFVGAGAGRQVTTGGAIIAIGQDAGVGITTGSGGVYLGSSVNSSSGSTNGELVIGTSNGPTGKGQYTGYLYCNGSIYQGNNSSSWATTSDRRLKKNIVDNTQGLDVISQIRVRNFEYRTEDEVTELPKHATVKETGIQLGVIAQELREVLPKCVHEESTGVIAVDSDDIFWHMVNAIKDLKALNDTLTARITALEAK